MGSGKMIHAPRPGKSVELKGSCYYEPIAGSIKRYVNRSWQQPPPPLWVLIKVVIFLIFVA